MKNLGYEDIVEGKSMEIKNFDAIIAAYKAAEGTDLIKEGDVRAKYTEVAEALGVDTKLLRNHTGVDIRKDYDRITDQTPLVVGEDDIPFVVEVVRNYCSPDYQHIRRRDFRDVPLPTIKYLIERFTKLLFDLGHERKTLVSQIESMEMVTQYSLRNQRKAILDHLREMKTHFSEEYNFEDYNSYLDRFQVENYGWRKIMDADHDIKQVTREHYDIRDREWEAEYEDLYEPETEPGERWNQETDVEEALGNIPEYVELQKNWWELKHTQGQFVKKKKAEMKTIKCRMEELRAETEIQLLERRLEPIEEFFPKSDLEPEEVLKQAIQQVKDFRKKLDIEEEEQRKNRGRQYTKEELEAAWQRVQKESHALDVWEYLR